MTATIILEDCKGQGQGQAEDIMADISDSNVMTAELNVKVDTKANVASNDLPRKEEVIKSSKNEEADDGNLRTKRMAAPVSATDEAVMAASSSDEVGILFSGGACALVALFVVAAAIRWRKARELPHKPHSLRSGLKSKDGLGNGILQGQDEPSHTVVGDGDPSSAVGTRVGGHGLDRLQQMRQMYHSNENSKLRIRHSSEQGKANRNFV
jgi:hypothetical protein